MFSAESLVTPAAIPVKLEPSPYSVSKYPFLTLTVFVPISKALSDVGTKWLIIFQPAPYLVSLKSPAAWWLIVNVSLLLLAEISDDEKLILLVPL